MLTPDQAAELPGTPAFDAHGRELGTVEDVFLNTGDDVPAWAVVALAGRRVAIPLDGAGAGEEGLTVRYDRDLVAGAPEAHGEALDSDQQEALYAHYGISDADLRDDTGYSVERPDAPTQGSATLPTGGADDAAQGHP